MKMFFLTMLAALALASSVAQSRDARSVRGLAANVGAVLAARKAPLTRVQVEHYVEIAESALTFGSYSSLSFIE